MDLVFDTFNWMEYVIDLYQQPSCKLMKRIEQDFKAFKKPIVVAYLFVWDIHALNSPSELQKITLWTCIFPHSSDHTGHTNH